jgi:hypothetical protein
MKKDMDTPFTEIQTKIIETEFRFFLKKSEGELEQMRFEGEFALGSFLFPLKKNLQNIFRSFIEECNQYGDFLHEDVIITNVKVLSVEEVKKFLKQNETE